MWILSVPQCVEKEREREINSRGIAAGAWLVLVVFHNWDVIVFKSLCFAGRLSWGGVSFKEFTVYCRPFSLRYGEREFEDDLMRGLYFMQNNFSCFSRSVKIHIE